MIYCKDSTLNMNNVNFDDNVISPEESGFELIECTVEISDSNFNSNIGLGEGQSHSSLIVSLFSHFYTENI